MTLAPTPGSETAPWAYPFYRLTLAVAAANEPEDIFDAALTALEEVGHVPRSSLLLFDEQGVMRFCAWRDLSDTYRRVVDGHSPWSPDTTDAAPVLVQDVIEDDELAPLQDVFRAEGIRALAFIPLKIGAKLLGKFMLYYAEPHVFDEREVLGAQIIAAHVAFAIDQQAHRALESRMRADVESLAGLQAAASTLWSARTLHDGLETMLDVAMELMDADFGNIQLLDPEHDVLRIVAQHGFEQPFLDYFAEVTAADDSLCGRALRSSARMIIEDVEVDELYAPMRDAARKAGYRAVSSTPLTGRDGVLRGMLSMHWREPHRPDEQKSAHLDLYVQQAVAFIDRHEADERLRQTAEESRTANAAKDEFLGLVSHELKTPLTTVRGNAEILARTIDALAPDVRDQALRDILLESERLQRIIENLLLLARAEQRDPDAESEPVVVRRVAAAVVERHRRNRRGRAFELIVDEESLPVLCSTVCIEQVIDNFLTNAEKYSPASEPITVRVESQPAEVRVLVLDRGHGVDPDEAEQLFTAFYRSELAPGHAAGLGIGLAVCKRLVEAHGGRIWARAREGGGSEFGFALPAMSADD